MTFPRTHNPFRTFSFNQNQKVRHREMTNHTRVFSEKSLMPAKDTNPFAFITN